MFRGVIIRRHLRITDREWGHGRLTTPRSLTIPAILILRPLLPLPIILRSHIIPTIHPLLLLLLLLPSPRIRITRTDLLRAMDTISLALPLLSLGSFSLGTT